MNSCSEEKKQSKKNKEENKYLKVSIMEKLSALDETQMKENIKKTFEGEKEDLTMLMMFYSHTGMNMNYCDAMEQFKLETDQKNKKEMYRRLYLKLADEECKIYREIYEKYNSMYLTAIETNSIPAYYYFKLQNENSGEGPDSIGIFPTKKECEYYSNLFKEKNIGFVSSCKEG